MRMNSVNSKALLAASIITREIKRYLVGKKDEWNFEENTAVNNPGSFTFGKPETSGRISSRSLMKNRQLQQRNQRQKLEIKIPKRKITEESSSFASPLKNQRLSLSGGASPLKLGRLDFENRNEMKKLKFGSIKSSEIDSEENSPFFEVNSKKITIKSGFSKQHRSNESGKMKGGFLKADSKKQLKKISKFIGEENNLKG